MALASHTHAASSVPNIAQHLLHATHVPLTFAHFALSLAIGLTPVLLFMAALQYLDSFRLVRFSSMCATVLLGMLAAALSYFVGDAVMSVGHFTFPHYSRYYAPLVEEGLKSVAVVWLFSRNRIGFMVDGAILGLAVGAGFSIFENVYFASIFTDANIGVWIVRGLGTALMHAGATAVFALCAQALRERHNATGLSAYIPGFLVAASLHSIFNQFVHWPYELTAGTIVVLPLLILHLFDKSEHEVHNWLVQDYESHEHLLADIRSGRFANSEGGRIIMALSERFSQEQMARIFAYIKLHTELVLRAENILLAKEKGQKVAVGEKDRARLVELHAMENNLGKAAMLAIWPHLKFNRRELFELHELEMEAS